MSALSVFEAMRSVIAAPGFSLLRDYRDDFYRIDREVLFTTYSEEARYLWIVRERGTHLILLGVHQKMHDEARAVLRGVGGRHLCFLIERGGLCSVSDGRALAALSHCRYQVRKGVEVSRNPMPASGPLAHADVRLAWASGPNPRLQGVVLYSPGSRVEPTLGDLVALDQIATWLVVEKSGSLFTPTVAVHWMHHDLRARLAAIMGHRSRLAA